MQRISYLGSISGSPISQIKNLTNDIIVSKADTFNATRNSALFSLKMVLKGTENYQLNGNPFALTPNSFLVVNPESEIAININTQNTEGICLFPSLEMARDIHRTTTSRTSVLLDTPFSNSDLPGFIEKKHRFQENHTGAFLQMQLPYLYSAFRYKLPFDTEGFYLKLLEYMIQDQNSLNSVLQGLGSSKKSTQEELYRRVSIAKTYIEDNFTQKLSLNEVAATACLSKYHFTRSFKALYKITPIQYVLQLRLQKAQVLLAQEYSLTEITELVGFSDIKNLRRAIKKSSFPN